MAGFSLSFSMVDDPDEIGGRDEVAAGLYHMKVIQIAEDGGSKGEMLIDLEVLRGTTPGMEGKIYSLKLPRDFSKWAVRKITAFFLATGLVTHEQVKASHAQGTDLDIPDCQLAVGKQICIELENNEYQGRNFVRLAWDHIWSPDDKRANLVPLHAKFIQQGGYKLPPNRHIDGKLAAATPAKPVSGKKPEPAPAAQPDALLDGIPF